MPVDYQAVLDYWFAGAASMAEAIDRQSATWWGKDPAIDAEIQGRFQPLLEAMDAAMLEQWRQAAEGWLAAIILLDQFSRNIYRGEARAFAEDERALKLTLDGIEAGIDQQLDLLQRVFFYLPLEHAESSAMQALSVAHIKQVYEESPAELKDKFRGFYDYALAHQEVIEKFGRYPHRNAVLGRASTAEEQAYLASPGSGF